MSASVDVLTVDFEQTGDFVALNAARAWCRERGISYGSAQADAPIGLLANDAFISKWRGMTPRERAALDGTIAGDMRNGPVRLSINKAALARARGAA